jgi:ferritin-like metal-binding protein YciE
MTSDTLDEQLVKYLADAHSIEEQALQQLRGAPDAARDPELAAIFREHLVETEGTSARCANGSRRTARGPPP